MLFNKICRKRCSHTLPALGRGNENVNGWDDNTEWEKQTEWDSVIDMEISFLGQANL